MNTISGRQPSRTSNISLSVPLEKFHQHELMRIKRRSRRSNIDASVEALEEIGLVRAP
jgi:hypothetical protein